MSVNLRQERIERLLQELRYEVERGMMEGEIDESMGFQFMVPISKQLQGGVVWCEFRTRPVHAHSVMMSGMEKPRLKVVK